MLSKYVVQTEGYHCCEYQEDQRSYECKRGIAKYSKPFHHSHLEAALAPVASDVARSIRGILWVADGQASPSSPAAFRYAFRIFRHRKRPLGYGDGGNCCDSHRCRASGGRPRSS